MKTYKGRKVIGVKPWTVKQILKIYPLLFLWTLFTIYLIVASIFWDIYLVVNEIAAFIAVFVVVIIYTIVMFRKEEPKNYIYEDE